MTRATLLSRYIFSLALLCTCLMLSLIVGSCESKEMKLSAEAKQVFHDYNACYKAEDFGCFRTVLDSTTVARIENLFTLALSADDKQLENYLKKDPYKYLNTYYTYIIRHGAKEIDLQTSVSGVLAYLIHNQYFGNDLTNATYDKIDHLEENSIWGFVVDKTMHETKVLSRILYKKEANKLKFSLVYRNSLINKRLFQANYTPDDIKSIIQEYFTKTRDQVVIRNFTELVKVVNSSANF